MPIFTAEIAGRPTVVLAALDHALALAFAEDEFIRSELRDLRTPEGAQLWDGTANMTVRPSSAAEQAIWERNLVEDLTEGVHESREDVVESNGFAFLVDYREPDK